MSCTTTPIAPSSNLRLSHSFTSAKLHLRATSQTAKTASSSSATHLVHQDERHQPLDMDEIRQLNLFLKSQRGVAKLRISDIVGLVDEQGERSPPAVRKGKIPSQNGGAGIQCCLVGKMPFERCEVVAMVVKRNIMYNTRKERRQNREEDGSDNERTPRAHRKGKGRQQEAETFVSREEVGKVFYDLDDDSGATISCILNPNKVYRKEMQAFKERLTESKASTSSSKSNAMSSMNSILLDDREQEAAEGERPKSDPRLWIYRYVKPPEPVRVTGSSKNGASQLLATIQQYYEPPVYEEGSLLRLICKIFINPKSGDRQLEALYAELIDTKSEDGKRKYAEWHHSREVGRLMKDVYGDKRKVAEMMGGEAEDDYEEMRMEQSRRENRGFSKMNAGPQMAIVGMAANTTGVSEVDSGNSTSLSVGMTSSLMNATAFNTSTSFLHTSSTTGKQNRTKLPSLRRIAEQKIPITREVFLLYMQQHFRKNSVHASPPSSSSSAGDGMILPDDLDKDEGEKKEKRISIEDLKEDKALDWLATKCSKSEAIREAELEASKPAYNINSSSCKSSSRLGKAASNSIISPSAGSPTRAPSSQGGTKKAKLHIRADYVLAKKVKLFTWAIQSLMREGVILVHLPGADTSGTPRAKQGLRRNCLCAKDGNTSSSSPISSTSSIASPGLAGHKCKCRPFSPPGKKQHQHEEETFSLITPDSLLGAIEPIVVRLAAYNKAGGASVENVLGALKRKDEMYRFVMRDTVKEAMEML